MRLPPCPEAALLVHACRRIGAVLVPLNAAWTDHECEAALAAAGNALVVAGSVEDARALEADGGSRGVPSESVPADFSTGAAVGEPGADDAASHDPESEAVVISTSGSSGRPVPVTLSVGNLEASARAVIARLGLTARDRWLAVLSPAHVSGYALFDRSARVGSTVVTWERFHAPEVADLLESGEVTHASLVPVMLERLLAHREDRRAPPTLACLLVGGAETHAPLLERALSLGYPVALTYGLTEATSQVATATPAEVRRCPGSVGRPLPGVELRIDAGGEILVRGPTVARPSPPSRGVSAGREEPGSRDEDRSVGVDAAGWLHTGDVGRLDEDGALWVTGRLSDRIVTGGVTVEPVEVESVVLGLPGVREVAAFGLPDPEWGERLAVAVVPEDPASPPSLAALLAFARDRLAPAKRPRELRVVGSLPRNANGKVERGRLRSRESLGI